VRVGDFVVSTEMEPVCCSLAVEVGDNVLDADSCWVNVQDGDSDLVNSCESEFDVGIEGESVTEVSFLEAVGDAVCVTSELSVMDLVSVRVEVSSSVNVAEHDSQGKAAANKTIARFLRMNEVATDKSFLW